jgi:hypothetical protein
MDERQTQKKVKFSILNSIHLHPDSAVPTPLPEGPTSKTQGSHKQTGWDAP